MPVVINLGGTPNKKNVIHYGLNGNECKGEFDDEGICNMCRSSLKEIQLVDELFEGVSRIPTNHPRVKRVGSSREVLSRDGE